MVSALSAAGDGMAAHYARRADEYERIDQRPERQAEPRVIESALADAMAGRAVLEIACGTGRWTPHGACAAASWRATDLNAETMAVARVKPLPPCVDFALLDAYALEAAPALAGRCFDAAFAGCWWSHVPLQRLPAWLAQLHALLPAGARVVFVDNTCVPGRSTPIARADDHGNGWQRRTLDDGSVHEVLKNHPTREQAVTMLGPRAVALRWTAREHFWVLDYGLA